MIGDPGVTAAVDVIRGLQQLIERPRVGHLGEQFHPLLILDPVRLHLLDRLAAGPEKLGGQDLARVVQGGLDDREHVQRVAGRIAVQQLDGGQRER